MSLHNASILLIFYFYRIDVFVLCISAYELDLSRLWFDLFPLRFAQIYKLK